MFLCVCVVCTTHQSPSPQPLIYSPMGKCHLRPSQPINKQFFLPCSPIIYKIVVITQDT